jgi:hypothetical protein
MFTYRAFGLTIHSTVALPQPICRGTTPDVVIKEGSIPLPFHQADTGQTWSIVEGGVMLSYQGIGSFLIRNGREILVHRTGNLEKDVLSPLIIGPALGVVLHQRQRLALHASSAVLGGKAVAFLGGSGWGKSTLAAALCARGHRLLSDDIVALHEDPNADFMVLPGFQSLKLWPDSARDLGHDPEGLPRLHGRTEKRLWHVDGLFQPVFQHLRCLYVLSAADQLAVRSIPPAQAVIEIMRHTYGPVLRQKLNAPTHLQQSARLARQLPAFRIERPLRFSALPDLVKLLEDHAANLDH